MPSRHLYIDAEWYIGGELFLIGYAYNATSSGQLYDDSLTKRNFLALLKNVKYIYCYGPDVGILENYFGTNLRSKYICINLLKVFRHHLSMRSYKLADVEVRFGIIRTQVEYKKNIFKIWYDWEKYDKKKRILKYNDEDVLNMLKLWKIIRAKYSITTKYLIENKLK